MGHDTTVTSLLKPELPGDVLPGPVEVTVRPLPIPEPAREDWFQFLLNARGRMEAAGCHFANKAEVQAYVEELREDDDRIAAAYRVTADSGCPPGEEDDARLPG